MLSFVGVRPVGDLSTGRHGQRVWSCLLFDVIVVSLVRVGRGMAVKKQPVSLDPTPGSALGGAEHPDRVELEFSCLGSLGQRHCRFSA